MCKIIIATFLLMVLILANGYFANASILSWFTGSGSNRVNSSTLTPPLVPVPDGVLGTNSYVGSGGLSSQYPEESGECSHWGDTTMSPYPMHDPMTQAFEFNKGLASPGELIGSHRQVPVGTIVAITNMKNGNTVSVRVVPPKGIPIFGRVMDLSPTAFSHLASLREGVITCSVRVIQGPRLGGGGIPSLSSYTFNDNQVLKVRPTSYDPRDSVQVGTGSSIAGLDFLGRTQNGFVNMAGGDPRMPPFPPVHIGSGYNNGGRTGQYGPGMSTVTAWNPEEYN